MERELVAHKASKITVVQDLLDVINSMKQEDASVMGYEFFPVTMKNLQGYSCLHGFSNYKHFKIPKKSGGYREISAPRDKSFKAILQYLKEILESLYSPSDYAMGFTSGRSVVTNAENHVGKNYVFNIDLKDFFPSIERWRVASRLRLAPFEFSEEVANTIADLCCIRVGGDNGVRYVLPQGAPTSPIITNMVCDRLDENLGKLAKWYRVEYTRYADDITFSSNHNVYRRKSAFRKQLKRIIEEQHFTINSAKTRLQKRGTRQEVTGVTVNERTNVRHAYVRDIRNALYIWKRYGHSAAESRFTIKYRAEKGYVKAGTPSLVNVISGKLQYLKMLKGMEDGVYKKLQAEFENLNIGAIGAKKKLPGGDFDHSKFRSRNETLKYIEELLRDYELSQNQENFLKALREAIQSSNSNGHTDSTDGANMNEQAKLAEKIPRGNPENPSTEDVTEFRLDELKKGNAVPFVPEKGSFIEAVQNLKRELGIYNFVNSGALGVLIDYYKDTPVHYLLRKIVYKDSKGMEVTAEVVVAAIKWDKTTDIPTSGGLNSGSFNTTKISTPEGEFQAIGVVLNTKNNKEADDIKEHILAERKPEDANKETYVSSFTTRVSYIHSGRLVVHSENGKTRVKRPLSKIPFIQDFQKKILLAIKERDFLKTGSTSSYDNLVQLTSPKEQPEGTVWVLTLGADGMLYPKACAVASYNRNDTPRNRKIDDAIKVLLDSNSSLGEKLAAKNKLQNELLYFGDNNTILINKTGAIAFEHTDPVSGAKATEQIKQGDSNALKTLIETYGIRYQIDKNKINYDESYQKEIIDSDILWSDLEFMENVDASVELEKIDWTTGKPFERKRGKPGPAKPAAPESQPPVKPATPIVNNTIGSYGTRISMGYNITITYDGKTYNVGYTSDPTLGNVSVTIQDNQNPSQSAEAVPIGNTEPVYRALYENLPKIGCCSTIQMEDGQYHMFTYKDEDKTKVLLVKRVTSASDTLQIKTCDINDKKLIGAIGKSIVESNRPFGSTKGRNIVGKNKNNTISLGKKAIKFATNKELIKNLGEFMTKHGITNMSEFIAEYPALLLANSDDEVTGIIEGINKCGK